MKTKFFITTAVIAVLGFVFEKKRRQTPEYIIQKTESVCDRLERRLEQYALEKDPL